MAMAGRGHAHTSQAGTCSNCQAWPPPTHVDSAARRPFAQSDFSEQSDANVRHEELGGHVVSCRAILLWSYLQEADMDVQDPAGT